MTAVILYTTEDGRSQIKLRAQEQTVWLTQLEMADLFDATKQNISLHLKNVLEDGENYQKVRDLFALSSDYDTTDKATQIFFATQKSQPLSDVQRQALAEHLVG